jgi:hypothetical protein
MSETERKDRFEASMAAFHKKAAGVLSLQMVTQADAGDLVVAAMQGDFEARRCMMAIDDFIKMVKVNDPPYQCLTCDDALIYEHLPPAFLVIQVADTTAPVMVNGLCHRCFAAGEQPALEVALAVLREAWPGLRAVPATHAPGHA